MPQLLYPHPNTPCLVPIRIQADIDRQGPAVSLKFTVRGEIGALLLPEPAEPVRSDGLWQRTCFEAFIRADGAESYFEINLSPSTEWAVYGFDRYREGRQSLLQVMNPQIGVLVDGESLDLRARLDLSAVTSLPSDADWHFGLSAVIEEANGAKSYWALAHPPGDPDFHHKDCFALELPAAGQG